MKECRAVMKAILFDGSLKLETGLEIPERPGESLVQVIAAGICNTDLEITKGYAGFKGVPGHEFVGRVVKSEDASLIGRRVVGEINVGCNDCELCSRGDQRHCAERTVLGIKGRDGAFAEFLSLPARNLLPIPDQISDEAAVFIEPLAAACQVLNQVEINPSTRVALVGDGKLAQLIVRALSPAGCEVTVFGKHPEKLDLAALAGANCVIGPQTSQASGFDVVIEASGSANGLETAIRLVRPRGVIVLKTTHHGATRVEMFPVVVNEISIIGSRCGRFQPAIDLLASGLVDVAPLVSERLPIDEGLLAFERAAAPGSLKVIISMR